MIDKPLGWLGIARLGLVQMALGSVVVLTTSTLNRVMVVELALPASLPGVLLGIHYALQVFRPRLGYGSDVGGRRTPWILGGMALLSTGGALAALATAWMASNLIAGIVLAVGAFILIGIGVGAAGTSLLVLLAKRTDERRRGAAAAIVWIMMIVGFIATTLVAGHLLDPFSIDRLVEVSAGLSTVAFVLAVVALWGIEGRGDARDDAGTRQTEAAPRSFRDALAEVWSEPETRRFTLFVFLSMIAYSAQELIIEPFAGLVFGLAPGQTTQLAGVQHGGALCGMVIVAVFSGVIGTIRIGSLRGWAIGGCVGSAIALCLLAVGGLNGSPWPIRANVFALGVANGIYAIAAIASMMALVGSGRAKREGVRMGLLGAAQATAFGLGGLLGSLASDVARHILDSASTGYAFVFICEAVLFVGSAILARRTAAARPVVHPVSFNSEAAR